MLILKSKINRVLSDPFPNKTPPYIKYLEKMSPRAGFAAIITLEKSVFMAALIGETMNCPKCGTKLNEHDLNCPNCKKVIRLKCHACGQITTKKICPSCGTVLINKCYKCGRLNPAQLENCPSCGLNIEASIGLREAIIENFAALTIQLGGMEELKTIFKNEKTVKQFRKNFYELLKKFAAEKDLRVQILDDTYIIRFCKSYTFAESASEAIDFALHVTQFAAQINQKLYETKGVSVRVKMAVQKRDVYMKSSGYHAGLNINLMYNAGNKPHLFNNIQVLADSYIYQALKTKYPFQSLSALYVKKHMVMFFELVLSKLINLEEKEENSALELPKRVDFIPEEEENDEKLIDFSSLTCSFLKVKHENILNKITEIFAKGIKNPIVCVKGDDRSGRLMNINCEITPEILNCAKTVRFGCLESLKYTPFGFLRSLMFANSGLTEFDVMANPILVNNITADDALRNLLTISNPQHLHPEDAHYGYFEAFSRYFSSINEKTVFIVDDFHNIDESSLEILKYLIETKQLGETGFLLGHSTDFSLHRNIYKLMTSQNFYELELKLSSNKALVTDRRKELKNIEKSFYFEKILENTRGSAFYLAQALNYLAADGVLSIEKGKYKVENDRMIVIPEDIDGLIKRKLLVLKDSAFEIYTAALLLGERVPFDILKNTDDLKKFVKDLKFLESKGFITIEKERIVRINNYTICRKNLQEAIQPEILAQISLNLSKNLLSKYPDNLPVKAQIAELAGQKKEAFNIWHNLSESAEQLGDFSAYLNTTNKYLSLVDNVIDPDTDKTVEQIKLEVYEHVSSMLYKFYPEKILNFLELLLENLEQGDDEAKIKTVANKLVQSCLISGNYANALEYAGKIISRTPKGSFNPSNKNFNLNYFLINLVTLEIYYNLGRLNDCIEAGKELFRHIDLKNLPEEVLPEGFSKKQFKDAIAEALFFISLSKIIQRNSDFPAFIEHLKSALPDVLCFKTLALLEKSIRGENIVAELALLQNAPLEQDKYAKALYWLICGLESMKKGDFEELGNVVYQAKLTAGSSSLFQIEYFCDLLIGFAYQKIGSVKKAKQIYYNVLELASAKGIKNITYLCWYFIAGIEKDTGSIEMATGILNNAAISIEKDENISEVFILLFKSLSAQILFGAGEYEKAAICINQAYEITQKYSLDLNKKLISAIRAKTAEKLKSIESK